MTNDLKENGLFLIKDALTYSITKIIPGLAGFLSVLVLFRMVGSEEYGKYSITFTFLMVLTTFSFGWLNQATLRYYSLYRGSQYLKKAFFSGGAIALAISLVLITVFYWFGFPLQSPVMIQILLVIGLAFFTFLTVIYQAQQKPQSVVKITAWQAVFSLALPVLFLLAFKRSYLSILTGLILAYMIPCIWIFTKKVIIGDQPDQKAIPKVVPNPGLVNKFLKYGYPLSFWYVASLSLPFLDRFFIKHFYGLEIMGSYAGFYDLVTRLFSVFLFPITLALHPRIMSLWNAGRYKLALRFLGLGLSLQTGLFIILFLGFFFLKRPVFHLVLKAMPQLEPSSIILLIPFIVGGFLWQLALLIHKPLELNEKSHLMLVIILVSLVVNLSGNVIFLPRYGVIATAYTTIVSAGVYVLISVATSRKIFKRVFFQ